MLGASDGDNTTGGVLLRHIIRGRLSILLQVSSLFYIVEHYATALQMTWPTLVVVAGGAFHPGALSHRYVPYTRLCVAKTKFTTVASKSLVCLDLCCS